jgi:hypothetical protein
MLAVLCSILLSQPPQFPALGKYNDQEEAIIRQHLQWCMGSNIFLWVMSWWGPTARNTETTEIMLDYGKPDLDKRLSN